MGIEILNMDKEQLEQYIRSIGEPRFRAGQILDWVYRKFAASFDEMSNLPQSLREKLAADCVIHPLSCEDSRVSRDGTIKYLLKLPDGHCIETVRIEHPDRITLCISTQVGCPVMCTFCASGAEGLVRNLGADEIVGQVMLTARMHKKQTTNIVVMGTGEPLLNTENLIPALYCLNDPDRAGIGARHMTVSTSGIVPGIYELADVGRQWNLAVSIQSPTDEGRARYIPDPFRYPLDEIVEACRYYTEKTSRMIFFEYVLIEGENDDRKSGEALARLARKAGARINVIPYNRTVGDYSGPGQSALEDFNNLLNDRGVTATVRSSRGSDIMAACGQLRARAGR